MTAEPGKVNGKDILPKFELSKVLVFLMPEMRSKGLCQRVPQ
ncbi:hypothetical protein [Vibrio harveyi]|nr:hypothetical protein [Vibrio harveyi]